MYNLKVVLKLYSDINNFHAYEKLSNFINFAMDKNAELRLMHEKNCYKPYCFCSLYPIPSDGIYRKENIYQFDIRSIDLEFIVLLKQMMNNLENSDFKVIMTNLETREYKKIETLTTITPCIMTTGKDYKIPYDMELVKKRIIDNAQKKYKQVYGKEIKLDFIKDIKQTNRTPIKIPYKNVNLLGYKFKISIKDDELSQQLAYLVFCIGVLEKNSLGFGFCVARKEDRSDK